MAAYARICRRLGETGAGQLAKMMNQICIAGLMQGLSEALAFGQKAGLDGAAVVEVISQGAAGSWQMVNRHKTMLADTFDFGFAVDWMRKDLKICLETADQIGAALPVTALVDQLYAINRRLIALEGRLLRLADSYGIPITAVVRAEDRPGLRWLCERGFTVAQFENGRPAIRPTAFLGEDCAEGITLVRPGQCQANVRIAE
jgi:hypothetical protein